jgi:hypothetical protein
VAQHLFPFAVYTRRRRPILKGETTFEAVAEVTLVEQQEVNDHLSEVYKTIFLCCSRRRAGVRGS